VAAGAQRDLLRRHAGRLKSEIATRHVHLDYPRVKASL
jgi:hypothetical protein